jgi:hypothetical protein
MQPSSQPTQPTSQPTSEPSLQPSSQPSSQPTSQPTSLMKRLDILKDYIVSIKASSINCLLLNRTKIDDQNCGNCFDGLIGDPNNYKTACVPATIASSSSKSCSNDCSSNGKCEFLNVYDLSISSSCPLHSNICTAKCNCNNNFHGDDCSVTEEELVRIQDIQENILTQLRVVANVDDPSPTLLLTTINATASLFRASNVEDMTSQSIVFSSNIIDATMKSASALDVPVANIMVFNNLVNDCIDVISNKDNSVDIKSSIQTIYESYVDTLGSSSVKQLLSKNQNLTVTTANMQIIVNTLKPVNTISSLSPNRPHEMIYTSNLESRRLLTDGNLPVVMSVTKASLYDTRDTDTNSSVNLPFYKLASNPIRLRFDCSLMNDTKVKVVLQNIAKQSYESILPISKSIKTVCMKGKKEVYEYTCEYSDNSKYNITVSCDGVVNGTLDTSCPSRIRTPSCSTMNSLGTCKLIGSESDSYRLTCLCDICSFNDIRRRKLTTDSIAYEVAGMTKFIFEDYVSRMEDSKSYSIEDFKQSTIVIVTFASILCMIIVYPFFFRKRISSVFMRLVKHEKGKTFNILPAENAEVINFEKALNEYVQHFLPLMYQQLSYLDVTKFLVRNHIYLNFLIDKHDNKFKELMQALRIVTIISACMFIVAALLNAEYPDIDNSCASYYNKIDCESQKSFQGNSYCIFNDEKCDYKEPSIEGIIIIINIINIIIIIIIINIIIITR